MGGIKKARIMDKPQSQASSVDNQNIQKEQEQEQEQSSDQPADDLVTDIMNKLQLKRRISKQQAVELNYLITQILNFPSLQQSENHCMANRLGNFDVQKSKNTKHKYCKCCGYIKQQQSIPLCTSFDSFPVVGISTYLFFQTIKNLIFLLILVTIIHGVFSFVTNLYCAGFFEESVEHSFTTDNMISWISLDSKIKASLTDQEGKYTKYYIIQMWIGVGLTLIWSLLLYIIRYYERKNQSMINTATISAADFSIIIENYPKKFPIQKLQENFNSYAQKLNLQKQAFRIQKINLSVDPKVQKKEEQQMQSLNSNYIQMLDLFSDWICQFQQNKGFPFKIQKRIQIYQNFKTVRDKRLKKGRKILKTMFQSNLKKSRQQHDLTQSSINNQQKKKTQTIAIVTFQYSNTKDLITQYNSMNFLDRIRQVLSSCCPQDKKFTLSQQKIKIQKAPEPQDIKWQNLSASTKEKLLRKAATYLVTLVLLSISFTIVYFLSVLQTQNEFNFYISFAISFTISLVNFIIGFLIRYLTIFEKDYTQTGYQTSLGLKSIWAQLLNTIVIPIIIHYIIQQKNIYGRNGLSTDVIYLSITNSFLPPLTKLLDPYYRYVSIRSYYYKKSLKQRLLMKQVELNQKQSLMAFETGYQYIYFISLYLFTAYFITLQPFISVIATFGMFTMYWIQKYSLLNRVKRPVPGTDLINSTMSQMISLGPIFFAMGALNWSHLLQVTKVKQSYKIQHYLPNILNAGLAALFLIFPVSLIFDKYLPKFIFQNLDYTQCKVLLNSQYDRTNPATMQEAFQQYYQFLKEYIQTKKHIKQNSQASQQSREGTLITKNKQNMKFKARTKQAKKATCIKFDLDKNQDISNQQNQNQNQDQDQNQNSQNNAENEENQNQNQNKQSLNSDDSNTNVYARTMRNLQINQAFIRRKRQIFRNRVKLNSTLNKGASVQRILGDIVQMEQMKQKKKQENSVDLDNDSEQDEQEQDKRENQTKNNKDSIMKQLNLKKCSSQQNSHYQKQSYNRQSNIIKQTKNNKSSLQVYKPVQTSHNHSNKGITKITNKSKTPPKPSSTQDTPQIPKKNAIIFIKPARNLAQYHQPQQRQQNKQNLSYQIRKQNPTKPKKLNLDFGTAFPMLKQRSNNQEKPSYNDLEQARQKLRNQAYLNYFGKGSKILAKKNSEPNKQLQASNPYDRLFK